MNVSKRYQNIVKNITQQQINRIKGREVFIDRDGREISATRAEELGDGARRRMNGPHNEAKWAKDVRGTNLTRAQRRQAALASVASWTSTQHFNTQILPNVNHV